MDSEHDRLAELFEEAADIASPGEQTRFLQEACKGNERLLRRVSELLEAHRKAGRFLQGPNHTVQGPAEAGVMEQPGDRVGVHQLLACLGEGGFSTVFLAEQQDPVRRLVALKILKPGVDTHLVVSKFEVERQALALMDHPGIAKVFDAGSTRNGRPYFAMEWVRGEKITTYCDVHNLSISERLRLFDEVCDAIAHAHERGIIHRDIKPSNILIAGNNGRPHPRVIDFGIAKVLHALQADRTPWTIRGRLIGTPAYMSPEQAQMSAEPMDVRSDVYSLGALLYELLTGQPPFDEKALMDAGIDGMMKIIREQDPPPPSVRLRQLAQEELQDVASDRGLPSKEIVHQLTGDLDWIVMKALDKDPHRRYQSATHLEEDIRRYLDNRPVTAMAPTLPYRLGKLIRRRKQEAIGATAVVIVLLACALLIGWQASKAHILNAVARKDAEDSLVNAQVTRGLAASDLGDYDHAVLWFANAAQSGGRSDLNAIRVHTWASLTALPVRVFDGGSGICALTFSPDGRYLLVNRAQAQCSVWDWRANQQLGWLADIKGVYASAWSPDGQQLALALKSGGVQIWAIPEGQLVDEFGQEEKLFSLRFSPDGQYLACGSTRLRIWDRKRRQAIAGEFMHPARIDALVYAPRSDRIATVDAAGQARVFSIKGQKALFELLLGPVPHQHQLDEPVCANGLKYREASIHAGRIHEPAFMAGGTLLATRDCSTEIKCWNIDTGECALTFEPICCSSRFTVSPDGKRLACGVHGNGVGVWDVTAAEPEVSRLQYGACVLVTGFSPDGEMTITSAADHTVRLWSVAEGEPRGPALHHTTDVAHVAMPSDASVLATAQTDGVIRLWRPPDPSSGTYELDYEYGPMAARLGAKGDLVIATKEPAWGAGLSQTRVYRLASGEEASPILKFDGRIEDAAISPAQDIAAVALSQPDQTPAGILEFVEVKTGERSSRPVTLPSPPACVDWHPKGDCTATICQTGELLIADAKAHENRVWLDRSAQPVSRLTPKVRFTPSGDRLVSLGPDGRVQVWDWRRQDLHYSVKGAPASLFWTFDLSNDGQHLCTATTSGEVVVWNAASGQPCSETLRHGGWVYSVRFSPDGQTLLTTCHDRQVRVWDWKTGKQLCTPMIHADQVYDAVFTPNGACAVTACRDGTARVWDWRRGNPLSPRIRVGARAFNISITPDGRYAAVGGLGSSMHVLRLRFLSEAPGWSPEAYRLLGEVLSTSTSQNEKAEVLDTQEWLARYKQLQALQPHYFESRLESNLESVRW